MQLRPVPLCIATCVGLVINLVLSLFHVAFARNSAFGTQQDMSVVLFAAVVFGVLGIVTDGAAGALYFWLNRRLQLTARETSFGGGAAGALSAVASYLLSALFAAASLVSTQSQSATAAQGALILGAALVVTLLWALIGGLAGALGSWLARRVFIGNKAQA